MQSETLLCPVLKQSLYSRQKDPRGPLKLSVVGITKYENNRRWKKHRNTRKWHSLFICSKSWLEVTRCDSVMCFSILKDWWHLEPVPLVHCRVLSLAHQPLNRQRLLALVALWYLPCCSVKCGRVYFRWRCYRALGPVCTNVSHKFSKNQICNSRRIHSRAT